MKGRVLFAVCGSIIFLASINSARAQASSFTYQGRLLDSNAAPATGNFQMQFKLHPASSGTNQTGSTLTNGPVTVSNGLFTVIIDFGAASFDGSPRWLEIGVRTNGSTNAFDILSPTQPITSAPYAIQAASATSFLGNIVDSQLSTNIPRFNTGGEFTGPVKLDSGTVIGTFSGTASGTFSGTFNGTTTGTNNGTFFGNGGGVTNLNVTNLVGVVQSNPNWQIIQSNPQQAVVANNYLTTNNAQTTLILPANPAVGNTVGIAGSGPGGWVLSQNAGQSIFTGNLGLPAGKEWAAHAPSGSWRGIASSADGLKVAAVVNVGNIFTSTDAGQNWTARATGLGNLAWVDIASSADGNKLVAVVNNGFIFTSSDSGSNWTQRATVQPWISVASSASGTRLAAAANNALIWTSSDSGSNWTSHASMQPWISIASSADGTKLAAAANNGQIFTSTDSGSNWTARASTQPWSAITSSADGIKLAATINGSNIFVSGDSGVSWSPRATSQPWTTISSSSDGVNLVAAVGGSGPLFTSFDSGETWIVRTGNNAWSGSVFSADGSRAAATVNGGQIFTSSSTTTSGTSGSLVGNKFSSVELQYVGNGLWMPLSAVGKFVGN